MQANAKQVLQDALLLRIAGRMAHVGGWALDAASERLTWSDVVCDMVGVARGSQPTLDEAIQFYPPECRARALALCRSCLTEGVPFDEEIQLQTAQGARLWVRIIGEAMRDDEGHIVQVQGACQDISDRKAVEQKASLLAGRLTTTLESITDAFLMLDRDWKLTYLNNEAERTLRLDRRQALGRNIWELFPEAVDGPYYRAYHKALETNSAVAFEEYYEPLDLWTEIRAYPSEEGLAVYFLDIRKRKAAEAEIHSLAYYDKLTGLPNRQMLVNRLEHALALCRRTQALGAVLFIDLDHFKSINDTRGHDKGDLLLQLVAARLAGVVRASDTVARFGGDEFVVLLEELGATEGEAARAAQETARKLLESFVQPFDIADVEHCSTPSIGITVFNGMRDTIDDVLRRSDLAMYQSKAAGRNTISFYDPEIQARVSARVRLEAELRLALSNEEFVLHYQPQAAQDGRVVGLEALVRWQHPQRGLVGPLEFITVAEETGQIDALGRWVLRQACRQLATWRRRGDGAGELELAVNVSASQFHRPDFVEQVVSALQDSGAPPGQLKLELTESLLLGDVEATIATMRRLKAIGVGFALDDFGTGYSSLAYLHRLPLDQLKIDRAFIRDAFENGHGAAIVRTIVALGKALRMTVLAEGVETAAQLSFILAEGCQAYQGYLLAKPMAVADLDEFMLRHAAAMAAEVQ